MMQETLISVDADYVSWIRSLTHGMNIHMSSSCVLLGKRVPTTVQGLLWEG